MPETDPHGPPATNILDPESRDAMASIPAQSQEWPGTEADLDPEAAHGQKWISRDRLPGKRAFITGGDSGIGRAVAVVFAAEGADVAIAHLPEEEQDAQGTKELVEARGRTCALVPGDLRTAQANIHAAEKAVEALGGIDVLVCNAAYQMTHPQLDDFPDEQIERTFATNVFSPFWLIKYLSPRLGEGGSIIVTTSVQAYDPSVGLQDYAATKAALNNLVVNLAAELGPQGIRVNAVAPGPIWTPLIPATMPESMVDGFGTDSPLGRAGQPVEVAAAHLFLASDEASYVSGTVVGVTGGQPVF